jgi:hypothetical protein
VATREQVRLEREKREGHIAELRRLIQHEEAHLAVNRMRCRHPEYLNGGRCPDCGKVLG